VLLVVGGLVAVRLRGVNAGAGGGHEDAADAAGAAALPER